MIGIRLAFCVLAALLCYPAVVWAGMPRATTVLNELPRMRLQTISFFLAGFCLSSLAIQLLWNYLRKDFSFLPRLSYFRAVGLVGLWGLLFILVLTMISGARELMTPGAWEPSGVTYRLAHKADPAPPDDAIENDRNRHLERLQVASPPLDEARGSDVAAGRRLRRRWVNGRWSGSCARLERACAGFATSWP